MKKLMSKYLNLSILFLFSIVAVIVIPQGSIAQKSAQDYIKKAQSHIQKNEYERAVKKLNQAIKINRDSFNAYYNLGIVYSEQGKLEEAIENYTQAIEVKSDFAKVYHNRADVRRRQGNLEGAIRDYTQAIKINPSLAPSYHDRGYTRSQQGNLEGAIRDYTQAIEINPGFASAYHNRGHIRQKQGNLVKAVKDLRVAAALFRKQGRMQDYQQIIDEVEKISSKINPDEQNLQPEKPNIYKRGETITYNDWSLKALLTIGDEEIEYRKLRIGEGTVNYETDSKEANGIFLVVFAEVKNQTNEMNSIPGKFYLTNRQGRKFKGTGSQSIFSKKYDGEAMYTQVPPNTSAKKIIAFDIPKNVESPILVWKPELSNEEIYKIDLYEGTSPQNFRIE